MSKYIRTKNGIYEVIKNELGECIKIDGGFIMLEDIRPIEQNIREANTIEELIQDNDMLYIYDLYQDVVLIVEGNIKPFGYNNSIKLKEWLKFKLTEFDLYIKQPNGDYHKVAEKKQYGKLVLI